MKASELRKKDEAGLRNTLNELAKKQFQVLMQHGSGQLASNQQLKVVRRNIARVKTLQTENLKNKGA